MAFHIFPKAMRGRGVPAATISLISFCCLLLFSTNLPLCTTQQVEPLGFNRKSFLPENGPLAVDSNITLLAARWYKAEV